MPESSVERPGGRPAAATREQLLEATNRRFLAGQRIEVQAICSELGLSRATVSRWYGSRDGLIGEVLFELAVPLFRHAERQGRGRGGRRLLDIFERQARALAEAVPLRRFLENEREAAQRILTASDGPFQPRLVALLQGMIETEITRGYEPPAEPSVLAYAIVRMGEAFLYADASRGFQRDFDRLRDVYAALLGVSR
jgi:AcrR family transcriptional regulator